VVQTSSRNYFGKKPVPGHNYDPLNDLHKKLDDEKTLKANATESARLQALEDQQRQADLNRNPYLPLKDAHSKVDQQLKSAQADAQKEQDTPDREEEFQARRNARIDELQKLYRADKITRHEVGYQIRRFDNDEMVKNNREFRERQGESRDTPQQPKHQSTESGPKENERNALGVGADKAKATRVNWILEGDARDGSAPSMSRGSGGSGGRGGRGM
jgi:hypothetical protein